MKAEAAFRSPLNEFREFLVADVPMRHTCVLLIYLFMTSRWERQELPGLVTG
jgi:hypothetical protein